MLSKIERHMDEMHGGIHRDDLNRVVSEEEFARLIHDEDHRLMEGFNPPHIHDGGKVITHPSQFKEA